MESNLMDEKIKEVYDSSVKAQDRELDLIKNRLEFINWLFGVASALLFTSVLAARTITTDSCPSIASENFITLFSGISSFFAIICTFAGKWQGYKSVSNRIAILTLLDIQKIAFLRENPPTGSSDNKAVKFSMFEYLPKKEKETYDYCLTYSERKHSEILWLFLLSVFVLLSLSSILALLVELTI